jgi:uncharacterized RDD family membrane protein YckC
MGSGTHGPAPDIAWRQEVVSRVRQHRARRGRPADPNALELDFSADTPHSFGAEEQDYTLPPPPERFHEILVKPSATRQEPKIIRFPRPQPAYIPTVEEVRLDELGLAEPVLETPRILEAAEPELLQEDIDPAAPPAPVSAVAFAGQQMELLPSFADIQLEPEEAHVDSDFDVIPRPAPMSQRFVSGLIDAGIVFIATGVFALTFLELAEEMPQSRIMLVCLLAASGIFWLAFQYIFLTYRRATPGMNMAQLELCTFAGTATSMFDRQTRALASALSGFSIGLGYAWALVDEDQLGWHDRISQTYLRMSTHSFHAKPLPKSRREARDPYDYESL